MSKTTQNLSATGQKVIYDFRMAAINPDREMTYSGTAAYEKRGDALDAYVLGLERKIRRLKDELKRTKDDQRGAIALALTKRMVIDIATARAAVDEALDRRPAVAKAPASYRHPVGYLPDPSGQ